MEKTPRANLSSAHSALVEQSLRAASSMSTRLMLAQRRFIPLLTVLALPGGCFQTHSISTADSGTRLGRDAPVADSARADAPIHDAAPDDAPSVSRPVWGWIVLEGRTELHHISCPLKPESDGKCES